MPDSKIARFKPTQLAVITLVVTALLWFTVMFDIPVARQILGFVFLSFFPGFALLHLLKLKLGALESVLFAVGLSIAFQVIIGLIINFLLPLIGISAPLSLLPLMIVTTVIVVILVLLGRQGREYHDFHISCKKLVPVGLILCAIVALSIVGTLITASFPNANNSLLLFMLVSISLLVGVAVFSKKLVPAEFYPLILFGISLALLFHSSLFSVNIKGGDIFGEYDFFMRTMSNFYWNSAIYNRLNAMLSVTILPTLYSTILGLEGTWVFKIVYPMIFTLVPLGLFQLFSLKVNKKVAFLSVFFFVSSLVFFDEIAKLPRQMIGELFYVFLFLTLFHPNIKGSTKWVFFFVFSFGLIVSHYSMAYIFLAFISIVWFFGFLRKRKTTVTASMILLFTVLAFSWFIYVSSASTFDEFLHSSSTVVDNFFTDFFNPQSRGTQVLTAIGVKGINTFWHLLGRSIYYITEGLVVIGFFGILLKKRRSFFNDDLNVLLLINLSLLFGNIVIPNLASTFNVTRFYHVTLFFLAPLCVLGGLDLLRFLSRKKIREKYLVLIIALVILIPHFYFQTGVVYEVTQEESYSLPLSAYRFDAIKLADMGVLTESEVSSAAWLSKHQLSWWFVYADVNSLGLLTYRNVKSISLLSMGTALPSGSILYLRQFNVYAGVVFSSYGLVGKFNVSQIVPSLNTTHLIYSSGSCEIYNIP